MKVAKLAPALLLSAVATSTALAQYDFDSGYVPAGSLMDWSEETEGLNLFAIVLPAGTTSPGIVTLELFLRDLSHTSPMDLNFYLYDAQGHQFEVMSDRGDQNEVNLLDLHFADSGDPLPAESKTENLADYAMPAVIRPEGGMLNSVFAGVDSDIWILAVIDDAGGDVGSLGAWRIAGTVVPEPVTLSLLAIGALSMLRRRR